MPEKVLNPFIVRRGKVGNELQRSIENAKRDGIRISEVDHGSQRAGSIQCASGRQFIEVPIPSRPYQFKRVRLCYELLLNSTLSNEAKYSTLVHELGHLYCGHLGTPNVKWWPDRRGLPTEVEEFEAESISYLVCMRLALETTSAEYLAGYVRKFATTPPISLDRVLRSSWLIEQMALKRLSLREDSSTDVAQTN